MPPNDRPMASMRRPRFDPAALDAVGSRWEDRSPGASPETARIEPLRTPESLDVQTPQPLPEPVAAIVNRPVLVPNEVVASAAAAAAAPVAPTEFTAPAAGLVESSSSRSLVARVGRPLGDGSRKGARTLRRMTVYLQPERASQLAVRCAQTGENMSDVIERALVAFLSS